MTIALSLNQFKKKFTSEQHQQINEEVAYYDLLMKFKAAREEAGMRNATVETLMKLSQAMDMEMQISLR